MNKNDHPENPAYENKRDFLLNDVSGMKIKVQYI